MQFLDTDTTRGARSLDRLLPALKEMSRSIYQPIWGGK